MASGASNQQTAQAGEHFVVAELNRRGAYAVTFAGNMPKIDILASNVEQSRIIRLQVKAQKKGTWHCSNDDGKKCNRTPNETKYWIFVDLSKEGMPPDYYIVPNWWFQNDVYEKKRDYDAKKKKLGESISPSKHHSVNVKRVIDWKDRWDVLRIF